MALEASQKENLDSAGPQKKTSHPNGFVCVCLSGYLFQVLKGRSVQEDHHFAGQIPIVNMPDLPFHDAMAPDRGLKTKNRSSRYPHTGLPTSVTFVNLGVSSGCDGQRSSDGLGLNVLKRSVIFAGTPLCCGFQGKLRGAILRGPIPNPMARNPAQAN